MRFPLIAVDIGNSRTKLGLFEHREGALPPPSRVLPLSPGWSEDVLLNWLPGAAADFSWLVASVQRQEAARLLDWLSQQGATNVRLLRAADLPLQVALDEPDYVGMDRLVGAVAANRLRFPGRECIVIDIGSAITVDLVSTEGVFLGGTILPGISMSARALHQFTDLLPLVSMAELHEPPPALGKSTIEAMQSGLFWGAVGAMRELIAQLAEQEPAQVFLTGGAAPSVAQLLCDASGAPAQFVPHLTLDGIALTAIELAGGG